MNFSDKRGGKLWNTPEPEPSRQETNPKVIPLQDRSYEAFKAVDLSPRCLEIERATEPSRFPAYSSYLDLIYGRHLQTAFTIVFSFGLVRVTGYNLGPVAHAIVAGNCQFIRQFDSKHHDYPAKDQPIIEGIELTMADEQLRKRDCKKCHLARI